MPIALPNISAGKESAIMKMIGVSEVSVDFTRTIVIPLILIGTSGCASVAASNEELCSSKSSTIGSGADCSKPSGTANVDAVSRVKSELRQMKGYKRDEGQTYLTLPEWYLVYSPAEYAQYMKDKPPSGFPYFGAIGQFWGYYSDVNDVRKDRYPFNAGYQTMVVVIGTSFTAENTIKGLYENTIGRVTEWTRGDAMTDEDKFAAKVAQDYVNFIRVEPWYEYSFAHQLKNLWGETDFFGSNMIRKLERKLFLSAEYSVKAVYATLITVATKAAYGDADNEILALAKDVPHDALKDEPKVKVVKEFEESFVLLSLPRYEEFRDVLLRLVRKGVRFTEIAGNEEILVTCIVPANWSYDLPSGKALFERPILTDPNQKRIAIGAPLKSLHDILIRLMERNISVEHIYDY